MAGGVAPAAEAPLWPRLGSARLGSARLGSARLGSARLGSARLGSARLGSAHSRRLKTLAGCQVFCRAVHPCSPSASLRPGNRARKATAPIVLTVVPCRFQQRPMTPAYRASSRCRKTLDRRASVRNVERTHKQTCPSLPRSLHAPHRFGKLKEFALWHNMIWPNARPLVDQWYAWSHLIPSATAARNVTGRHLQIMDCSGGALRGIPGGAG